MECKGGFAFPKSFRVTNIRHASLIISYEKTP